MNRTANVEVDTAPRFVSQDLHPITHYEFALRARRKRLLVGAPYRTVCSPTIIIIIVSANLTMNGSMDW